MSGNFSSPHFQCEHCHKRSLFFHYRFSDNFSNVAVFFEDFAAIGLPWNSNYNNIDDPFFKLLSTSPTECPVCREDFTQGKGLNALITSCQRGIGFDTDALADHQFHIACFFAWFSDDSNVGRPHLCPQCTQPIVRIYTARHWSNLSTWNIATGKSKRQQEVNAWNQETHGRLEHTTETRASIPPGEVEEEEL